MDLQTHLSVSQWLEIPIKTRFKLKDIFGIPRSEGTAIKDGTVVSDGYTYTDLKTISLEKMQAYLGDGSTDFFTLFHRIITRLQDEEKLNIDEFAEKARTENIAKWTLVLKAIQKESKEYGLNELFNNLLTEIFFEGVKPNAFTKTIRQETPSDEGAKKRGRPAKKVN